MWPADCSCQSRSGAGDVAEAARMGGISRFYFPSLAAFAVIERRKRCTEMPPRRLVERIRSEFLEMPGLQLTQAQAARLWGLDQSMCANVIDVLIADTFLRRTSNGCIVRAQQ